MHGRTPRHRWAERGDAGGSRELGQSRSQYAARLCCRLRRFDHLSAAVNGLLSEPGETAEAEAALRSTGRTPRERQTEEPQNRNGDESHDQPQNRQAREQRGDQQNAGSRSIGAATRSTQRTDHEWFGLLRPHDGELAKFLDVRVTVRDTFRNYVKIGRAS